MPALDDGEASSLAWGRKGRPNPWRPLSLHPFVLLTFAFFSLSFVALLEILSFINRHRGAITFADSEQGFERPVIFAYSYLPTIIAIIYSSVWNWIDLDIKRLEPFFQMSRAEGAVPQNSIHLHYPFEFIAFAPLRALKRGSVARPLPNDRG